MKEYLQVFLASASEDKDSVIQLYLKLKNYGFKPWLDKFDLIAGQNWSEEISKAIRNSNVFIACLSKQSVQKQGYLQKELRLALSIYAEKTPGTIYFIPVKLNECDLPDLQISELGIKMSDIHWLELWQEDGFERLLKAIQQALDKIDKSPNSKKEGYKDIEIPPNVKSILSAPFDWCYVPSGVVNILTRWDDEDQNYIKYRVESFYISKYPITYEQYQIFLSSLGDYRNDRWLDALYNVEFSWPHEFSSFGFDEIKIGQEKLIPACVRRYEAIAFCRWLAYELMHTITVPSEAHWQRAAQGNDEIKYPWGNQFNPMRCNSGLSGIGRLTPVTRYPDGASPFGVIDLCGNTYEWCALGEEIGRYYNPTLFHPRNSSYEDKNPDHFRCAYRGLGVAPDTEFLACFRLCIPSSISPIEEVIL